MRLPIIPVCLAAALGSASMASAQQPPATPPAAAQPFVAGPPLKLTPNAKTYGGFRFCGKPLLRRGPRSLRRGQRRHAAGRGAERRLRVAGQSRRHRPHAEVDRRQPQRPHAEPSARQRHRQRQLYVVDIDTVRWFDMTTGQPLGSVPGDRARRASTTWRWRRTAPSTPRRPATRQHRELEGLQDHAAGRVVDRSSAARRSTCPTASPSMPRATSWS